VVSSLPGWSFYRHRWTGLRWGAFRLRQRELRGVRRFRIRGGAISRRPSWDTSGPCIATHRTQETQRPTFRLKRQLCCRWPVHGVDNDFISCRPVRHGCDSGSTDAVIGMDFCRLRRASIVAVDSTGTSPWLQSAANCSRQSNARTAGGRDFHNGEVWTYMHPPCKRGGAPVNGYRVTLPTGVSTKQSPPPSTSKPNCIIRGLKDNQGLLRSPRNRQPLLATQCRPTRNPGIPRRVMEIQRGYCDARHFLNLRRSSCRSTESWPREGIYPASFDCGATSTRGLHLLPPSPFR